MKKFPLNWREAEFLDNSSLQLVVLDTFIWFVTWEDLDDRAMVFEGSLVLYLILWIQYNHYQYSFVTSHAVPKSF